MEDVNEAPTSPSTGGLSNFLVEKFAYEPLSPMHNNVLAALCTVIYVKIVMEIGVLIRVKGGFPELSRKFIHLCACSWVVFWPLFDSSHWSWKLNVTVPVAMSVRLFYKGAILRDPEDDDVRSMSRTSSPSELLYGPLQMTLIMCYVGLTKFMTGLGLIIMASFVGDGFAALVGVSYGKITFKVPLGGKKSVEGTLSCFLGTIGGICFFYYMLGFERMNWNALLSYGAVSAIAEATAMHNWDNAILVLAMTIAGKQIQ